MPTPENDPPALAQEDAPPRPPWSWKSVVVVAFVSTQLFILAFRNPIDLWGWPMETWGKEQSWWDSVEPSYLVVDRWTARYEKFLGVDQGWSMFTPPVARAAPFLAARLEFDDGSEETQLSPNELGEEFLRFGGWRQRKLEDMLYNDEPELRAAYVRWSVRAWRERNPGDPRAVVAIALLRRRVEFPALDDDSHRPAEAEVVRVIGTFKPDGSAGNSNPDGSQQ